MDDAGLAISGEDAKAAHSKAQHNGAESRRKGCGVSSGMERSSGCTVEITVVRAARRCGCGVRAGRTLIAKSMPAAVVAIEEATNWPKFGESRFDEDSLKLPRDWFTLSGYKPRAGRGELCLLCFRGRGWWHAKNMHRFSCQRKIFWETIGVGRAHILLLNIIGERGKPE